MDCYMFGHKMTSLAVEATYGSTLGEYVTPVDRHVFEFFVSLAGLTIQPLQKSALCR